MLKRLLQNERFMEIFRFGITGGLSFIVDYAVMFLFERFTPAPDWLSIGLGFTVSVIFNYWLCACWVFRGAKKQDLKAGIIFIGSSVVGLGLTELLMWLFMMWLGLYMDKPIYVAKIIVTLIVMVWNYIMKRIAVYGTKGKTEEKQEQKTSAHDYNTNHKEDAK